ncbi:serine/threonine-protein kinase TNNI3K-like isoform X2 [Oscarella lobularis]|uniref:serine/threonine-protein kinase TNNI3K-like isoform X2 n=1 Tax=Oscarella lobularis TaxID=121494 RepID=UPI00331421C2
MATAPCTEPRRTLVSRLVGMESDKFLSAIERGSTSDVSSYLKRNPIKWKIFTDELRSSPLHFARDAEMASYLITAGADVEAPNKYGRTPFLEAAIKGNSEVLTVLLETGCNHSAKAKNGNGALALACEKGHVEIAKRLVGIGVNVNEHHRYGFTSLHWACWAGHVEMAEYLLSAGADIEARSKLGVTPFLEAAFEGREQVMDFLIIKECNIYATDEDGDQALSLASMKGHLRVVKLLIELGLDINYANQNGCTPLLYASENGHVETADYLISAGANIEFRDKWGRTPFLKAVESGEDAVISMLIEKGCNIYAKDSFNSGALEVADLHNHVELKKQLLNTFIKQKANLGTETKTISLLEDEVMKEVKSTQRASLELCDQATQTEAGQGRERERMNQLLEENNRLRSLLSEAIAESTRRCADLEAEKDEVSCQLSEANARMCAELAESARQCAQLEEENARISSQLSAESARMQAQLTESASQCAQLEEENEAISSQLSQLSEENAAIRAKLAESARQYAHLEKENARVSYELTKEIARMRTHLAESLRQGAQQEEENASQVSKGNARVHALLVQNAQCSQLRQERDEARLVAEEAQRNLSKYEEIVKVPSTEIEQSGIKLGGGAYGEVRVGHWRGCQVAVKTFFDFLRVETYRERLEQEISICSHVHHPNVVSLLGVISQDGIPLSIVSELLEGSLSDVIKAAEGTITLREQVDVSVGCSAGVSYLHGLNILHGDIRSTNVVVTSLMEAKICDLGAARFSDHSSLSAGPMSPNYLAPERSTQHNTKMADVYSLGVTFIELMTGREPAPTKRMVQATSVRHPLIKRLGLGMVKQGPRERPLIGECLSQLIAVQKSDQEYRRCPAKRMVKGKVYGGGKVHLVKEPWL